MARQPRPAKQVRYKVLRQCFVNGSISEPGTRSKPNYILADPGLAGAALELAPDGKGDPVGDADDASASLAEMAKT